MATTAEATDVGAEIAPGVTVRVLAHELAVGDGAVPCWTYVSRGLASSGQREIVHTLRRAPDETTAPADPLSMLRAIAGLAQRGQLVGSGGFTGVNPSGLFAARGWSGWIYANAQPLPGIPVPPRALCALAVTADELALAMRLGAPRITARLGEATRYYPFPPWSERHASVARADEPSVVGGGIPVLGGLDVTATQVGEHVRVRVTAEASRALAAAFAKLPADAPWMVPTDRDEIADARLIWRPGQTSPAAISAPGGGARLGGNFFLAVPQQAHDDVRMIEDGFAALLTDACAARLRDALAAHEPLHVLASGLALTIEAC